MEDIVKNRRWLKFKKEPCPKFLIENKNYIQKEKKAEEKQSEWGESRSIRVRKEIKGVRKRIEF